LKRSAVLWFIAWIVTLGSAVWQRMSGPTYPVRVNARIDGAAVSGKLLRSHDTSAGQPVTITAADTLVSGIVRWRRVPTDEPWQYTPMERIGDRLVMTIPPQPMAGKVAYRIALTRTGPGGGDPPVPLLLPPGGEVVTRFKGAVPTPVLAAHILLIFLAMLWSTRAGLAAVVHDPRIERHVTITCGLLFVSGLLLGPLVQKAAFGVWWSGWPVGRDLTDNKTALAMLLWLWTLWRGRGGRNARGLVIAAAVITFAVFAIPHSTAGSEHDYRAGMTSGAAK
jgi:hypothetical protein